MMPFFATLTVSKIFLVIKPFREIQLNQLRIQGQEINNRAYQNAGDFAWNTIIERELQDERIRKLGLEVSLDEIYDYLLLTPPPQFQNALMNAGFYKDEAEKFDTESYQKSIFSWNFKF